MLDADTLESPGRPLRIGDLSIEWTRFVDTRSSMSLLTLHGRFVVLNGMRHTPYPAFNKQCCTNHRPKMLSLWAHPK